MSPRRRPIFIALTVLGVAWAIAVGGFYAARNAQVTPDKIRQYLHSQDFARLSPSERRKALRKLAAMFNSLSPEDRRTSRMEREFGAWFRQMDESEKGEFLELTVPTGFNQMLSAFEQMPEDRRRRAIEDSVRRLREAQRLAETGEPDSADALAGNPPTELSPEMRDKLVKLGVKTFLDQGSAETKAELQPVLEEMQRNMESGRLFRSPGRRPRNE